MGLGRLKLGPRPLLASVSLCRTEETDGTAGHRDGGDTRSRRDFGLSRTGAGRKILGGLCVTCNVNLGLSLKVVTPLAFIVDYPTQHIQRKKT